METIVINILIAIVIALCILVLLIIYKFEKEFEELVQRHKEEEQKLHHEWICNKCKTDGK